MKKTFIALLLALLVIPTISFAEFKTATLEKGGDRVKVTSQIQANYLFAQGYKLEQKLGAVVSTGYRSKLTSSLTANGTTISVSSNLDLNGIVIPCTDNSRCYFNLEPGGAKQEPVVCTGIGVNTFTGCIRGLVATGNSEVGSSTLAYAHNAGVTIILTNIAQFYSNIVDNVNNQTIGGVKTFTNLPLSATTTPTLPGQFITLYQFQQATSTGGINASESVKGVSQLATPTQAASSTSVGSTGAILVLPASLSTSTGGITTSIPVTKSNGKIDDSFLGTNITGYLIPAGTVNAYVTSTAPTGWLLCNGSLVSTTTYSDLFAIVGYTFGGSTSTFALPDLRGRQIMMATSTGGYATSTGLIGGEKSHIQTIAEMAAHKHNIYGGTSGSGSNGYQNAVVNGDVPVAASYSAIGQGTDSVGSSAAFNVLDPYLTLNYIIKY